MRAPLSEAIRQARLAKGLSQQSLARAAGVTQPHLSRIERGLDCRLSILGKVVTALGADIALVPVMAADSKPYDDEIANRQYLLGHLAAKRISASTLKSFRDWLLRMRARQGDFKYYREWLDVCAQGPGAVASLLTDPTERGRYMRAVATMRPFVSRAERDLFYKEMLPEEARRAAGVA